MLKCFFDMILIKDYPPLCLKLAKQVLSTRNWLLESIKNYQIRNNKKIKMIEELLEK